MSNATNALQELKDRFDSLHMKNRLGGAYRCLRGRPVAYRLLIKNGTLTFDDVYGGALIAECLIVNEDGIDLIDLEQM